MVLSCDKKMVDQWNSLIVKFDCLEWHELIKKCLTKLLKDLSWIIINDVKKITSYFVKYVLFSNISLAWSVLNEPFFFHTANAIILYMALDGHVLLPMLPCGEANSCAIFMLRAFLSSSESEFFIAPWKHRQSVEIVNVMFLHIKWHTRCQPHES